MMRYNVCGLKFDGGYCTLQCDGGCCVCVLFNMMKLFLSMGAIARGLQRVMMYDGRSREI